MPTIIQKTASKIAVDYFRLSIVRNLDGFLAMDEVAHALKDTCGLTVVKGTDLALRIHYELNYKQSENDRFVYLSENPKKMVPDMKANAYMVDFEAADLFPMFANKSLLKGMSLEELSLLYKKVSNRRVAMMECNYVVADVKREVVEQRQKSVTHFRDQFQQLTVDWTGSPQQTIAQLSQIMVEAIKCGVYEELEAQVQSINQAFQTWVNQSYFAQLNSNHLLRPKSVNKVLPYIEGKHQPDDKVALVVVDGLAYWQYSILQDSLAQAGIPTQDNHIFAWIPTITMLSRQAIFRGDTPVQDYKQCPQSEQKLWTDFWTAHGVSHYALQYISDKDEFAINEGIKRLAYVTVEMDEKMHSSTDYKDLLSLTENWCSRIIEKIKAMRTLGYTIYLTTDHGNLLSQGWQVISAVDKVFLYKDGSRGKRHLIFNEAEEEKNFCKRHEGKIALLSRDNWLAVRSNQCFEREGQQVITHGGSHFWEVVIPFITI